MPPAPAVEMKGRHGGVRTIVDASGIVRFLGFAGKLQGTDPYIEQLPSVEWCAHEVRGPQLRVIE